MSSLTVRPRYVNSFFRRSETRLRFFRAFLRPAFGVMNRRFRFAILDHLTRSCPLATGSSVRCGELAPGGALRTPRVGPWTADGCHLRGGGPQVHRTPLTVGKAASGLGLVVSRTCGHQGISSGHDHRARRRSATGEQPFLPLGRRMRTFAPRLDSTMGVPARASQAASISGTDLHVVDLGSLGDVGQLGDVAWSQGDIGSHEMRAPTETPSVATTKQVSPSSNLIRAAAVWIGLWSNSTSPT